MLIEKLKEKFGERILESQAVHGEETIVLDREQASEILRVLHDDPEFSFEMLVDETAVDYPERTPRFDVVYHLNSLSKNHRLSVKVRVGTAAGDDAWAHSVYPIWKSADWLERECFDMFGIEFRAHPDLRRILLYDSFVGYPLRKNYPYNKRQPIVEEVDPVASPRLPPR